MKLLIDKGLVEGKINYLMEIEKDKIQAVYKYLQNEFPECDIEDWYGCDKKTVSRELAQTFKISCKEFTYFVTINEPTFEDKNSDEIYTWLVNISLAEIIPKKNISRVIVGETGIVTER